VEVTGTNAQSIGMRYYWGVDAFVLKPGP